ncbi:MAG: (d)CMP kinase [Chloroflexota bacterium]
MTPPLITIDGPVAAGKSSVGNLLAQRLGYLFVDTGLMYRALTWKAVTLGIETGDDEKLASLARNTEIDVANRSVFVDGAEVSALITRREVGVKVPFIARIAEVRQAMVEKQRKIASRGGVIMAGRDIGTVVLPQAGLKVYLEASLDERVRRRHMELQSQGKRDSYKLVLEDIARRDDIDTQRSVSPLRPAEDATIFVTDGISLEQVVDRIVALLNNQ